MEMSGMLVGNFCFDPKKGTRKGMILAFSTSKRYQKQQHMESFIHSFCRGSSLH